MSISEVERWGIGDLLLTEEQNIPILLQVAKSITKSVVDVASAQDALEIIYTHVGDAVTLLNKRHITKEVLFKYLHCKKVPVTSDFTKGSLVNKVVAYWRTSQTNIITSNEKTLNGDATEKISSYQPSATSIVDNTETQYPIHVLARKFTEWYFENYNKNNLMVADYWSDARLLLRIAANDRVDDQECFGADCVIETLVNAKSQFGFFFNPNLTHAGVQGRMDVHGLVLVLACGTLHTNENCVGVFECTFGLLRDPFAENNWKVKTIQCTLRSQGAPQMPSLQESDTLQTALSLPIPMNELT